MMWPPLGVRCPEPFGTAAFRTALLVVRRFVCVWCHKSVKSRDYTQESLLTLGGVILMGVTFLVVQAKEYYANSFRIADRVFGSCFYLLTGFHGFHVIVGTLWLAVRWGRIFCGHFSKKRHFGLTACF